MLFFAKRKSLYGSLFLIFIVIIVLQIFADISIAPNINTALDMHIVKDIKYG